MHVSKSFKDQPPNLWRPQQFYTGRIGAPPKDAPTTTASEWNKEAPTSGHVEALFAEKVAKTSPPAPTTQETQTSPEEVKVQLPVTVEAPSSAVPSATTHTVISVVATSNGEESKAPRVVTLEVSASDAVTTTPADKLAQVAPAA